MDLQNIFLTLWNMSLTGSVIICIVLLARLFLRRAPKVFSYVLWSVVLFRLLCPVSVSSVISVLSFTKAAEPVSRSAVTVMDYSSLDIPGFPVLIEGAEESNAAAPPRAEEAPAAPEIPAEDPLIPEVPAPVYPQTPAESGPDAVQYAVMIWLVGLGVMLVYNVYSCIRLFRQIESAVPLRRELYLADHISTAFVLGIINPKIYLPSYLSKEERGYIIAHERCHIKRMDHVFRLLAYLALCLHWFNPLVWLAFVLSGKDMEMSCDEAVIRMYGPRIRAEYAQSLLRLATGRRSFALTPLAFGEGDTKERVINMSKWKKPRIWAVICALVACIAVLVACATNPAMEVESTEKLTEASMAIATEPIETQPLWDENTDLKQVCIDAINDLLQTESYYLQYQSDMDGNPYTLDYRRYGENELINNMEEYFLGSYLMYEGRQASFLGDFWVWGSKSGLGANETLSRWSPDFVETTSIWSEGSSISFEGTWHPLVFAEERHYHGTVTFTFNPDGSLQTMERQYVLKEGDELVSGAADKMTVMQESPEDTLTTIKAVAVQCITDDQLEQKRFERDTVSDIPSNKTMYDTDYELGAGQMGWKFFDDDIKFKYGAVSDDGTSATVTHYVTTVEVKSIVAEDSYWLEEFVDGKWQYVDNNLTAVSVEKRNVETKGYDELSYKVDWSDTYGKLPAGFYRMGRYHTVTLRSGESETRPCYAKFRVMGENWDVLLEKCADAMEKLASQHSYHIVIQKNLTDHADPEDTQGFGYFPYTISTHTWKFGEDFLEDARYVDRTDTGTLHGRRGSMRRDGISYNLEWSGREVDSPLSFWGTNTYYTPDSEMYMETSFMWIDSLVGEVTQKGNQISVMTTAEGRSVQQELVYTFDSDGDITRVELIHHPVAGSDRIKESVVDRYLEVLDTPAQQICDLIQSQDVSQPMPFSYAMDVEDFPDARKEGFVNVHPARIVFVETVIGLADMECTMKGQEPGVRYNMIEVYRDENAGMWKVVLRYSQNIEGDQAIYINDQGVTQMIVTYTEENDPANVG